MRLRNNLRILGALTGKEYRLMIRNPIIPKMVIIMPIAVMLLLPMVATMDVHNVKVAVVDNDHTQLSRRLLADLDATEELEIVEVYGTHSEAMATIENDNADVILTIPANWSRTLVTGNILDTASLSLDVEANGVNATKGMLGARYVSTAAMITLSQWQRENGLISPAPDITVSNRYNPTLNFRNFMIPALLIILLIIICGFLPTLNLVSEKESGTIEAMNVSPVSRFTFVLSKLIPFWIAGLFVITVGMIIGGLTYRLIPEGNIGAIYLATLLFILIMSGIGVVIANTSSTMLQSIFMMFAIIMIFQLMGGLFTPISSMPGWAQAITYILPPRYFNEIIRAIYLKGAGLADLMPQYTALSLLAIAVCVAAALTYRKRS